MMRPICGLTFINPVVLLFKVKTKELHCLVNHIKPHSRKVPRGGVEPPLPKETDFESAASANSAIRAYYLKKDQF